MSNISKNIDLLKAKWGKPREAIHRGKKCPFPLSCTFNDEPVGDVEAYLLHIPKDFQEFWKITRCATLFKDQQYSQWGIEIMEPSQAIIETRGQAISRPGEFKSSDLVIARFFGDTDLVVLACNPDQLDFGSVTIARPIDKRSNWPIVSKSFDDFLSHIIEVQGDKYWEA